MTAPKRSVTSFMKVEGGGCRTVSVKTRGGIPKDKIWQCMEEIRTKTVKAPVKVGDVLIADVAGTGVDVTATSNAQEKGEV